MIESIIEYLLHLPWPVILLAGFLCTFIENIFPPSPSDSILLFLGSLTSMGTVPYFPLLITASIGSILGFYVMFKLGKRFNSFITTTSKFSFIDRKLIVKVEKWFHRWGYWIIVANRGLSGTRGVISFFAGMSHLPTKKTMFYASISAVIWNVLVMQLGRIAGEHWETMKAKLGNYESFILIFMGALILFFLVKFFVEIFKKRKAD
jgi:membrane protein DedA with SNARE-associated domain